MAASSGLGDLKTSEWRELQEIADRFEKAWQKVADQGEPPDLARFLPPPQDPLRKLVLQELIKIDLEYRWRTGERDSGKARLCLEDYARLLGELGPSERLSAELIGEEYRVRQRWGDCPKHAEYVVRFPRQGAALLALLQTIDAELGAERATCARASEPAGGTAVPAGPAISSLEIIEVLRQPRSIDDQRFARRGGSEEQREDEHHGGFSFAHDDGGQRAWRQRFCGE